MRPCPTIEALEERKLMAVHFAIDPMQDVHGISRFIYGVNPPLDGTFDNSTLTRLGGNRWTAYNWENNASNAGNDWFYENDDWAGGGNTPGGGVSPTIQADAASNSATMLTIPMAGYVAADKLGGNTDIRNSPNYLTTRLKQVVAAKGAPFSLNPNTNDGYVYADEFVNWVKANYPYGQSDPTKPIFFSLDNEPDLWSDTHPEVHPNKPTYAELTQKGIDFASAIKNVEPSAMVFGPATSSFEGAMNLREAADANNREFIAYYLQRMKQASDAAGQRLLDVLDLHYYSDMDGVSGDASDPATVAARVQAPRSLWDPSYTENSWIVDVFNTGPVQFIRRFQDDINANYPGTKLSFSEYNYGGWDDISGGIAEADALGVFGREGLYAAMEHHLSGGDEPFIRGGFAMFRNYDGNNSSFGDTSVMAATDDDAKSSIYASYDSANPNIITLVAINKTNQALPALMNIANIAPNAAASVYTLTGNSSTPNAAGQLNIADPSNFTYTMPAMSVSTIRIDASVNPGGGGVTPTVSFGNVKIKEGNRGQKSAVFNVSLDSASDQPVTVHFATSNGTAKASKDYKPASGQLTFNAGETIKSIRVPILGDTTPEPDETFTLSLSNPANASLGNSQATGTIVNDDRYTARLKFNRDQNWGAGYRGWIKITNTGRTSISPWTVEFDLSAQIDNIWDAQIVSHAGNHYVITGLDYDQSVRPGQFVRFGFTTVGETLPSGYKLNSMTM